MSFIKHIASDTLYHQNSEYGTTGIPVPTVEGINFVNAAVTLGTVSTTHSHIKFKYFIFYSIPELHPGGYRC